MYKNMYYPKLISFPSPSLQPCLLTFKVKSSENQHVKRSEAKGRQDNGQTCFSFKTALIGRILEKNQNINLLVHNHYSWFTFGLCLVRGPKALSIDSLRDWTMEVGLSSRTMENHLPWFDFMVHGVTWPR